MNRRSALSNLPLALACWLPLCLLAGCGVFRTGNGAIEAAKKAANHAADASLGLGYLGVIAFACIAIGIIILVASFVPVISGIVPRKAAVAAIACGVGVHLLRAFLDKFQTAILWGAFGLVVVACACLIWPLLVAAHRGTLLLKARQLLGSGHVAEAVAFTATAKNLASDERKALLAKLLPPAPGVPAPVQPT